MQITPGMVFGRYEIRARIGAGGMGEVYRAEDKTLLRPVAIKFIVREHSSPEVGRRALREARAASQLNHPNIVTVYEIGETDEHFYIVMECVEGQSLRQHVAARSLDTAAKLNVAAQVAEALAEAHARGIIHRDIKPENIIVNRQGRAKLLDFGLARGVERAGAGGEDAPTTADALGSLTTPGAVTGTIPYMSPEQLRGERGLDSRTDVFSFGIMLYELLYGRHPFRGANPFEIASHILSQDVVKAEDLADAELPPNTPELIVRLLEKDHRRRPASFADIRRELLALQDQLKSSRSGDAAIGDAAASRGGDVAENRGGVAGDVPVNFAPTVQVSPFTAGHEARGAHGAVAGTPTSAALPSVTGELAPPPPTVLVMPLDGVGGQEDAAFIGVGLASLMTTSLSKVNGLAVLSKPAGGARGGGGVGARGLARESGATILLEGEVMRLGQRVRIMARLIDVASGRVVWGDKYQAGEEDLFDIMDGVCEAVAAALKLNVTRETRAETAPPAAVRLNAFELYSKGRAALERRGDGGSLDDAIRSFEEALRVEPDFALAQAGLGEAYWMKYEATREGAWVGRALGASERALALDPLQAQVRVARGVVYHGTGELDKALAEFEQAVSLQPLLDDAHRWLGRCHMQRDDMARAVESFKRAIEIRPGYWDNYNQLGICYYTFGDYHGAANQFRRVISIQPDNFHGYNNLGGIYSLLGLYEDAAAMHRRAIEIHAGADACANLGTDYFYLGRFEEAVEAYRKAIGLRPSDDVLYRNLGDAYLRLGRARDARAQFVFAVELLEEALGVRPNDALVLGRLAVCRAKLGRGEEALAAAARAEELEPHNTTIMYQRAVAEALAGRADEAVGSLGRALAHGYSRAEAESDPDLEPLRGRPEYEALLKGRD